MRKAFSLGLLFFILWAASTQCFAHGNESADATKVRRWEFKVTADYTIRLREVNGNDHPKLVTLSMRSLDGSQNYIVQNELIPEEWLEMKFPRDFVFDEMDWPKDRITLFNFMVEENEENVINEIIYVSLAPFNEEVSVDQADLLEDIEIHGIFESATFYRDEFAMVYNITTSVGEGESAYLQETLYNVFPNGKIIETPIER